MTTFAVSDVRLDRAGVSRPVHGHLPDRQIVVAAYGGGRKPIVLDGLAAYEREIHDMERIV